MKRSVLHSFLMFALLLFANTLSAQVPSITMSHTNVLCNGGCNGTATPSISGGTPPYSYSWSPSGQMTAIVTGLCAGNYTLTVTDALSNTNSASVTITQPMVLALSFSITNSTCGNPNGAITTTVTGGTPPYTYSWNTAQITPSITNITAGNYTLTVTDANGCTVTHVATVTNTAGPTLATSSTSVNCFGGNSGTATVTVTAGGTPPFTYSWNTLPAQTTNNATNLAAGNYTATVTDANGCQANASVTITQPPALTISFSITNATCGNPNGAITATISGGMTPYAYSWSQPNIGNTITNLTPGSYTLTISDANGCVATQVGTVTNTAGPALTMSHTSITCYGGSNGTATVTVTGGTSPYTYSWNPAPAAGQGTASASGLAAGNYTVTVTDANGCQSLAAATITQPAALTFTGPSSYSICQGNGTTIAANFTGGTSPYSFTWSPINSLSFPNIPNPFASPITTTTYTCTITDGYGCTATGQVTVTVNPLPTITTSGNVTVCNGNNTTLSSSGAITYSWSPSTDLSCNTCSAPICTPTSSQTYTVTGTDGNGCTNTATLSVTLDAITLSSSTSIPAGCHNSDGSLSTNFIGGIPPYTYNWSTIPAQFTASALNITSGTYSVTITDSYGCISTQSLVLGDSCKYVWPGDANDDGVADNNDILAIGIGNGTVGTTRANASLTWIGQPSNNWVDTLVSGTNYKFIDCNGDGTIDNSDTTAVVQNFSMVHNVRLTAPPPYDFSLPDLYIHHTSDTVAANTYTSFQIGLGRSTLPANNIYGLAFTIHFNSSLVVPSSVRLNMNSSWMGTNGLDLIGVGVTPTNSGICAIGIVRTNHANISGNGYIASVSYKTSNSLTGTGTTQQLGFTITGVNVISFDQSSIAVNSVNDSIIVSDPALMTGLAKLNQKHNTVFAAPNPFSDYTTFYFSEENSIPVNHFIELSDAQGRFLGLFDCGTHPSYKLDGSELANGIYFYRIIAGGNESGRGKLSVVH